MSIINLFRKRGFLTFHLQSTKTENAKIQNDSKIFEPT